MFQDTLLIIKCDYMHKRKALLIYLLEQGFQIQGQRKLLFTPELAAEFYHDMADDPCFMFQVILLSKGNSEAFIVAKESAPEELVNAMVCYFGTSMEMERNVHVTKCHTKVQKEISFIFPNYIYEPIYCPEQLKFCTNNPVVSSLVSELYDIVTKPDNDPNKSWKEKLAESLILSNRALPHVSNRCSHAKNLQSLESGQQTKVTCFKHAKRGVGSAKSSQSESMDFSTDGTSLNITSSSCLTCSGFGSNQDDKPQIYAQPIEEIIKAKTAPLSVRESSSSSDINAAVESLGEEMQTEEIADGEQVEDKPAVDYEGTELNENVEKASVTGEAESEAVPISVAHEGTEEKPKIVQIEEPPMTLEEAPLPTIEEEAPEPTAVPDDLPTIVEQVEESPAPITTEEAPPLPAEVTPTEEATLSNEADNAPVAEEESPPAAPPETTEETP